MLVFEFYYFQNGRRAYFDRTHHILYHRKPEERNQYWKIYLNTEANPESENTKTSACKCGRVIKSMKGQPRL